MQFSFASLPWLPAVPTDWPSRCKQLDLGCKPVGNGLQLLASYNLNAAQSLTFARALSRCRKAGFGFAPLAEFRLGVLASNTFDLVVDCLPAACARHGVAVDIVTAPYDQVAQQALDPQSQINAARLDAVLIAVDHHWLALDCATLDQQAEQRIDGAINRLRAVVEGLRINSGAVAILQTVPTPPQSLFGSYDRLVRGTVRNLIDRCNEAIVAMARETGSYLLDTAALAERIGLDHWFNPIQWTSYKFPFDANCCPAYAETVGRLVGAIRGKARKCLVLDLDNTIWGGVIGDDGVEGIVIGQGNAKGEAFLAIQRFALELRERGIMLAVSSKNNDDVARRPFREHAEMALREQHISVFQANWLDKPSNLESIAKALNIGLDALVLLDDNPAERAQVRAALPMVAVPEIPEDPNWYAWTLGAAGYFEAVTFAAEDRLRVEAVAADAQRAEVMAKSRDLGDYLSSLDMVITFAPFDQLGRQRITQLINKTNQFNLTTRRYTEAQVAAMETDPAVFTLQVRLQDRFGDLGMIGVTICRPDKRDSAAWMIDTWLMSCRVLGRCVEQAMLARIVAEASQRGIKRLIGQYIPTAKNGMVAEHYQKLGLAGIGKDEDGSTSWLLETSMYTPKSLPMRIAGISSDAVDRPVIAKNAELSAMTTSANEAPEPPPPVERKLAIVTSRPKASAKSLAEDLATNLRRGDRSGSAAALNELMRAPNSERVFQVAEKQIDTAKAKDLLLDLQLEPDSASFDQLWSIAQAGLSAEQSGRQREFEDRIADMVKAERPVSFRELDYVENFPEFLRTPLMKAKYAGIPEAKLLKELWPAARRLSERLNVDRPVLDFLYERNRRQGSSKVVWQQQFKEARCVYHLILDHKQSIAVAQELVDEQALQSVAQSLEVNGATLALFCHVGFVRPTMAFLKTLAPNSLVYGSRDGPTTINAKSNARAALFAGLKALQQNRPVLIASDGTHGNLDGEIRLLGQPYKVGTGAAWLAFETKCNLGWLRMRHQKGRFVPELVEGPRRREGEDYGAFRTRFLHFYEQMMEDQLTGDPADLVLTRKWQKLVLDYCKARKASGANEGLTQQARSAVA